MKDKTGSALAAAIIELAKAINRLAATNEKSAVYMSGGGYSSGTWTGLGQPGGGGVGGVGGSPGGVHPQGGGGGGAHGGGMANVIRIDTPA